MRGPHGPLTRLRGALPLARPCVYSLFPHGGQLLLPELGTMRRVGRLLWEALAPAKAGICSVPLASDNSRAGQGQIDGDPMKRSRRSGLRLTLSSSPQHPFTAALCAIEFAQFVEVTDPGEHLKHSSTLMERVILGGDATICKLNATN